MFKNDQNIVSFSGNVQSDFLPVNAALHAIICKQGYEDVVLDFSASTFVSASFMVPLVTMCRKYKDEGVDFTLKLPDVAEGARLFYNTDWAHLIDPDNFKSLAAASKRNLAATTFSDSTEAHDAVDTSIRIMLGLVRGLDRSRISALEWALSEVVDNVLNHASSSIGGIMQVMTYAKRREIEIHVCDAGITIPRSLRQSQYGYDNDALALRAAIDEGVTKNKDTNRGNGLFGTFRCCEVSGGQFDILSGRVSLKHRPATRYGKSFTHVNTSAIPFGGTFVRACIRWDYHKLLEEALVFRGRRHVPSFDFVEKYYESDDDSILFVASEESASFGTREAGREARTKIENLMNGFTVPVNFDFAGVRVISSSYADEVFGKIVSQIGGDNFKRLCRFRNTSQTVELLIDRAINQRASEYKPL